MAYRYGNREQTELLPTCIEDYIGPDDPVRAYDAFVEALDLPTLGIELDEDQVGNPEYDPRAMLKVIVYGYSYGERSSRKLERAVHHNLSFIWLAGGLKPDHKTIAEFRRRYKTALQNVLKQSVRMCMKLGLVEGNTLFVDGTKMRANASLRNTWTASWCKRVLAETDKRIASVLAECEAVDAAEGDESLVRLHEELRGKERLREKVAAVMQELAEENRSSVNTVDKDCVQTHSTHGSYAGYNAQLVVDERHGLIVNSDVVRASNDQEQFADQVKQAHEVLGRECMTAVADAGYSDAAALAAIHSQGIEVVVPVHLQKDVQAGFTYDATTDSYTCPEGHRLHCVGIEEDKQSKRYAIESRVLCHTCSRFGECTKSIRGRRLRRSLYEDTLQTIERNNQQSYAKRLMRLRSEKVERPFGHIRHNLGMNAFLLRGIEGVKAEMALVASCFNVTRMIKIIGVPSIVALAKA